MVRDMTFTYRCPRFLKESLNALTGDEQFITVIGCGFVNSILLWADKIDQGTYLALTMATVAVFIAAKTTTSVAESSSRTRVAEAAGYAAEAASNNPPTEGPK